MSLVVRCTGQQLWATAASAKDSTKPTKSEHVTLKAAKVEKMRAACSSDAVSTKNLPEISKSSDWPRIDASSVAMTTKTGIRLPQNKKSSAALTPSWSRPELFASKTRLVRQCPTCQVLYNTCHACTGSGGVGG